MVFERICKQCVFILFYTRLHRLSQRYNGNYCNHFKYLYKKATVNFGDRNIGLKLIQYWCNIKIYKFQIQSVSDGLWWCWIFWKFIFFWYQQKLNLIFLNYPQLMWRRTIFIDKQNLFQLIHYQYVQT